VKLADLRRLSIKKQAKIHFRLRNGMECVVNEQGVAHVPALTRVPDFNLEEELAQAGEFLFEPISSDPKRPHPARRMPREELSALASDGAPATAAAHDHEDE
jgi:hypothetical protein